MADHAFDPTPISELPADEPTTPMWLPALGAALFIAVGAWWALSDEDAPAADTTVNASASATAKALPPPTPARAAARRPARPARPASKGGDPVLPTDKATLEALQKRLLQQRKQKSPPAKVVAPGAR
jgi:hypothetical protein